MPRTIIEEEDESSTRGGDSPSAARLDRFYLSEQFSEDSGTVYILPGTTLSDHVPVALSSKVPDI